ncbi:MAG: hypothetical protein AAGA77_02555 [Bacteroidota bacterium]
MKQLFALLSTTIALSFLSCGDSVDCSEMGFTTAVNDEIDKVNEAILFYNDNPVFENCEAVREAANNYFEVVESFRDCSNITASNFNMALQNAQDAVDSIFC